MHDVYSKHAVSVHMRVLAEIAESLVISLDVGCSTRPLPCYSSCTIFDIVCVHAVLGVLFLLGSDIVPSMMSFLK